jgi:hypothetical protein
MKSKIIGREDERQIFEQCYVSNTPEFIAIISANGLKTTMYSEELVSGCVTLDSLFSSKC